ncbi:hypothetical protein KSP40_PGU022272 [Platanthera guangdongensis]|uniref:Uncharacterized protein n=1 Tax=Platanthera guangdongensis TaxID=2320717 RepID=A0ABR2MA36_9ASPA
MHHYLADSAEGQNAEISWRMGYYGRIVAIFAASPPPGFPPPPKNELKKKGRSEASGGTRSRRSRGSSRLREWDTRKTRYRTASRAAITPNTGPYLSRFPVSSPASSSRKRKPSKLPLFRSPFSLFLSISPLCLVRCLEGGRGRLLLDLSLSLGNGSRKLSLSRSTSLSHDLSLSSLVRRLEGGRRHFPFIFAAAGAACVAILEDHILLSPWWPVVEGTWCCDVPSRSLKRALLKSTVESRFGAQIGV